jgi:hypothetical protein
LRVVSLTQAIWKENLEFWKERNIMDDHYYEFMYQLVESGSAGLGEGSRGYPEAEIKSERDAVAVGGSPVAVARLATLFIANTLSSAPNSGAVLLQWVAKLKVRALERCPVSLLADSDDGVSCAGVATVVQALYADSIVACIWLLQTLLADPSALRRFLFESADERTREEMCSLLAHALQVNCRSHAAR